MTPAEKLCLACGLCCDGTLFGHVRLRRGDEVKKLKALGLPVAVTRTQPPLVYARQPCAALCIDRTCRLYADRPGQCRTFECGVFKAAQAGRIPFSAARRTVQRARQNAAEIRRLLRALGDAEESRPLTERFLRAQRRMEAGGADAAAAGSFAELGLAMHRFNLLVHEKFHVRAREGSAMRGF